MGVPHDAVVDVVVIFVVLVVAVVAFNVDVC